MAMFGRSVVAIDIGSSSVKIVELTGGQSKKIRHLGLELLPAKVIEEGVILDQEALRGTIKNLLKKLKIQPVGNKVGMSLSGNSVIIKRVSLDKSKDDPDFYEYLYHEAEQYLQYDVSELYVDWDDLPQAGGGSAVILVGAKRDVVEEYMSLLSSLGLKIAVIDCDALAAVNILTHSTQVREDFVAVANIGFSSTQISFLINGSFAFTREISIGGNNYSEKIVEMMGLDMESAETLKITMSQGDRSASDECQNIINELNGNLAYELQATIEYYFQSGEAPQGVRQLKKIYLIGGGSKILNLDKAISETMQIPATFVNPFRNISVSESKFSPQFLSRQGHLFGVCHGSGSAAFRR